MDALCPAFVANNVSSLNPIVEELARAVGRPFSAYDYDDFTARAAWSAAGPVVLYVADRRDAAAATRVAQQARLRRSPLNLFVAEAGDGCDALAALDPYLSGRFAVAGQTAALVESVRRIPAQRGDDETLSGCFAARLAMHTPSLLPQADRLALAASHDFTVLLTGETGTGKTYLARLIHEFSPRSPHPFLMVPCGAQTANLFESTFFGHVRGSFTGAHQTRPGKFAAAGRGTIFLDEIDTLGLEQQAALLRVIETGEYELVGGNETLRSEARLIVASNWDLEESVAQERFRQDLFYRLNVMSFHLEPLRNRRQDIPLLARSIAAHYSAKFGKDLFDIAADAQAVLESYHWPGNIRQLDNVLHEAVLVSRGPELTAADLPRLPGREAFTAAATPVLVGAAVSSADLPAAVGPAADTLFSGRVAYERGLIQRTLQDCKFNRSRAARTLGISRVTLYKKIKQYGLTDLPHR